MALGVCGWWPHFFKVFPCKAKSSFHWTLKEYRTCRPRGVSTYSGPLSMLLYMMSFMFSWFENISAIHPTTSRVRGHLCTQTTLMQHILWRSLTGQKKCHVSRGFHGQGTLATLHLGRGDMGKRKRDTRSIFWLTSKNYCKFWGTKFLLRMGSATPWLLDSKFRTLIFSTFSHLKFVLEFKVFFI